MATYASIYDMTANATYVKQITVACRVAANNIVNESAGTANHVNRLIWANAILAFNNFSTDRINRMVAAATANPTLQAGAPAGPWVDTDIQFVVNSLIDLQANSPT